MDLTPFLEIDMRNIKETYINQLKKFCKDSFDCDKIFSTAEELKFSSLIKNVLASEYENPSETFVKFMLNKIYDGQKNQKVIEKFTPVIKRAFSSFVNEMVNDKISAALTSEPNAEKVNVEPQIEEIVDEPASKLLQQRMKLKLSI